MEDSSFTLPYTLPSLTLPYPARTNPHYSQAECEKWVRSWLSDLKVETVYDSRNLEKLVKADTPKVTALFQPDIGEWEFYWSCKYFLFLFITDDMLDEMTPESALEIYLDIQSILLCSFPDDPTLLENQGFCFDNLEDMEVANVKRKAFSDEMAKARAQSGTVYAGDLSVVGNLFRDMWEDALQKKGKDLESLRLLAHSTQDWIMGTRMEMEYRNSRKIPELSTLIRIRRLSSACKAVAVLVDVTYETVTPISWFYSAECERMIQAMNDFVSWHNDIWSFKKEVLDQGDVINVVLVFSKENDISYNEAANMVLEMVRNCLTEFEIAATNLEKITPPHLQRNFVIYRDVCRTIMAGTNDWHTNSYRFY